MKISNLRRGRGLLTRRKRARLRRTQPRYAQFKLRSDAKAPPRGPGRQQPYLGSDTNVADLLK